MDKREITKITEMIPYIKNVLIIVLKDSKFLASRADLGNLFHKGEQLSEMLCHPLFSLFLQLVFQARDHCHCVLSYSTKALEC